MCISLVLPGIGYFERLNVNGGDVERRVIVFLRVQDGLTLLFRNLRCKCIERLFFRRERLGEGEHIELRPEQQTWQQRWRARRCAVMSRSEW